MAVCQRRGGNVTLSTLVFTIVVASCPAELLSPRAACVAVPRRHSAVNQGGIVPCLSNGQCRVQGGEFVQAVIVPVGVSILCAGAHNIKERVFARRCVQRRTDEGGT